MVMTATDCAANPVASPHVAFVIPAHNEVDQLGATLGALATACTALGEAAHEVVVVDDASTDGTGELARSLGATVVRVECRQIAAARNAGARATTAPILVFIDADTHVNAQTLGEAMAALREGAVGGGAMVELEGRIPFSAKVVLELLVVMFRLFQLTGGCFLFCRRDAFVDAGGFDEMFFAGEEIELAKALKREGQKRGIAARRRFRIVRHRVVTSGRKVRAYTTWETLRMFAGLLRRGRTALHSREGLEFWYERRPDTR
jgi:cellulose synthase/poly-beta-1,6-N-acetylglucosamine synthase-like glycosyltransferase